MSSNAQLVSNIIQGANISAYSTPGARIISERQIGIKDIIHLGNEPDSKDSTSHGSSLFFKKLLFILRKPVLKSGKWQKIECSQTTNGFGSIAAHFWKGDWGETIVTIVNLSAYQNHCYVQLPFPEFKSTTLRFKDMINTAFFIKKGKDILKDGLFLDMKPWSYHVFDVEKMKTDELSL